MNELLDIIETEYFQATLYELLESTVKYIINNFMVEQLKQKPE